MPTLIEQLLERCVKRTGPMTEPCSGTVHHYAILVVRRSKTDGPPTTMDLLHGPIDLHESGQLQREADSYKLTYRTTPQ